MLNISVNLETGVAKLTQATTIKAGGVVPVKVTFSSNPGTDPVIELALSPQSSVPAVKAYLDTWEAQSQTVHTGALDANDARLVAHMAGKQQQTFDCEVVVTTVAAGRRLFPNFPVAVQPPVIDGPEASEGGPVYLTEATGDARYTARADNLADLTNPAEARENLGLSAAWLTALLATADLSDLPTSDPGDGKLWRNGGALWVGPIT